MKASQILEYPKPRRISAEGQIVSADEFYRFDQKPEYDDFRFELVNGVVLQFPLHSYPHGLVAASAGYVVGSHIKENDLGYGLLGGVGYIVERKPDGADTVYGLDFAYYSYANAPDMFTDAWLDTPPDLVIEVVEYSDQAVHIQLKIMKILQAGAPQVWAIYPENRTFVVHAGNRATTWQETDTIEGGERLPGFTCQVSDFFDQLQ